MRTVSHSTGGGAEELSIALSDCRCVHVNKAYDKNKSARRSRLMAPFLCRSRNAIKRMFGRLKDYRHSATNFLAALRIAATVSYWT